jgi:hypothetical protein
MGLLDDAIREHLELKRRRGADPGEVAREQREALDPVPREDRGAEDDGDAGVGTAAPELDAEAHDADEAVAPVSSEPPADGAASASGDTLDANLANTGETAELDMRSVLGEEEGGGEEEVLVEEDSLEWEVPADAAREHATPEAADPATAAPPLEEDEPADDVLEETPDFLRETPEQERLWFEQRPPRDFDFDK